MKCIFCPNDLDGSDEHIILNSLNGKIHSKDIICSSCNNFFGLNLDTIGKDFFNPILLMLGLKNASGIVAEDLEGNDNYLVKKKGETVFRKPKIKEVRVGKKKAVFFKGDKKNGYKYYEKNVKNKKGVSKLTESIECSPLRVKIDFTSSPQLALLLNKIAIEYCGFNKLNLGFPNELTNKVISLDENLNNVSYCSLEDVRKLSTGEISHLIKLWNNESVVTVYIELFNLVCAAIIISSVYKGDDFQFQYYQDALSGQKKDENIEINKDAIYQAIEKEINYFDFKPNVNKVIYKLREREINDIIDSSTAKIIKGLNDKLAKNEITKEQYDDLFIEESSNLIAQVTLENPYFFEDIHDANNDELNYYHSNLRENQFDDFCKKNHGILGKKVEIQGDGNYVVEKIIKIPVAEQNGIKIVNVRIVLFNGFDREYIPYRDFFENIKSANNS